MQAELRLKRQLRELNPDMVENNTPHELRRLRFVPVDRMKRPLRPNDIGPDKWCDWTNPINQVSFDAALRLWRTDATGVAAGIACVLDGTVTVIDVDLPEDDTKARAAILKSLHETVRVKGPTYMQVSGGSTTAEEYHFVLRGAFEASPACAWLDEHCGIELYCKNRYIVLTGDSFGTPSTLMEGTPLINGMLKTVERENDMNGYAALSPVAGDDIEIPFPDGEALIAAVERIRPGFRQRLNTPVLSGPWWNEFVRLLGDLVKVRPTKIMAFRVLEASPFVRGSAPSANGESRYDNLFRRMFKHDGNPKKNDWTYVMQGDDGRHKYAGLDRGAGLAFAKPGGIDVTTPVAVIDAIPVASVPTVQEGHGFVAGSAARVAVEKHKAAFERYGIPLNFAPTREAALAIAYQLVSAGANKVDTSDICGVLVACGIEGVVATYLRDALKDAKNSQRANARSSRRDLPIVKYSVVDPDRAMTEAELILADSHENQLFVFEGRLVRVEVSTNFEGEGFSVKLREVTSDMMLDHIGRDIRWQSFDKDNGWVEAKPPVELARMMCSRSDRWPYRRLKALARCPFLRDDGEVVSGFGYHEQSGIFLTDDVRLEGGDITPQQALKALRGLFNETAFANPASESAVIAGTMTAVLRPMFDVTPGWVMSAHEAGSGKSAPQQTAGIIATGQEPAAIAAGKNEEEFEKRIVGAILNSNTIIMVDNLNGELKGELVAQMVSQPKLNIRRLGSSDMTIVQNNQFAMINGNNIQILDEQRRRYFACYLEPSIEDPHTRVFKKKILAEAMKWRGYLLNCVLTIARDHIRAGCPLPQGGMTPLAGFDHWSSVVRASLMRLGMPDPLENAVLMKAEDPADAALRAVIETWPRDAGPLTTSDLIRKYPTGGALHEALMVVAGSPQGHINGRSLGKYLAKVKGVIKGGVAIWPKGKKDGQVMWGISEDGRFL